MEIYVNGVAKNKVKPTSIQINFSFHIVGKSYEQCYSQGTKAIEGFVSTLNCNEIDKTEIKTSDFSICKKEKWNRIKQKDEDDGYEYNYYCNLTMDYDIEKMSKILNIVKNLKNAPASTICFELKEEDKQKIKNELMATAYKNAENQAMTIANASNTKLKECLKISFEPLEIKGNGYRNVDVLCECSCDQSSESAIEDFFVPEDIETSFTLYTLWLSE